MLIHFLSRQPQCDSVECGFHVDVVKYHEFQRGRAAT